MDGEGWPFKERQGELLKRLQDQDLWGGRRSSRKWNVAERMTSVSCRDVRFNRYTVPRLDDSARTLNQCQVNNWTLDQPYSFKPNISPQIR